MQAKRMWTKCVWIGAAMVATACGGGSDVDAGTTPDGGSDAAQGDAGESDGSTTGDAGDDGSMPADCEAGEQDNDGDGVCTAACAATDDCGSGTCSDEIGVKVCVCDTGYAGDACDTCADGHEGDDCGTCSEGHVESQLREGECIVDPCTDVECGDHSTEGCGRVDDTAVCACDTGWGGQFCNGCADGYEGAACDSCAEHYEKDVENGTCVATACEGVDCGNGTCVPNDSGEASCNCDPGWALEGDSCDTCALGYLAEGDECILDLPVQNDNLLLWLDAESGTTTVGDDDNVTEWDSRVGFSKATQLFPANRPTLTTSGRMTYLTFTDTAEEEDAMQVSNFDLRSDTYSIFIAARPSNAKEGNQAILGGTGTSGTKGKLTTGLMIRSQSSATSVQYTHRSPFALTGTDDSVTSDGYPTGFTKPFQIISAERRSTEDGYMQVLRGGTSEVTTDMVDPAFDQLMLLNIGARTATYDLVETNTFSDSLRGDIGEIIVYNRQVTEDEREQIEAYLRQKWRVRFAVVTPKF